MERPFPPERKQHRATAEEQESRHPTDALLKTPRLPLGPWIFRKMVQFPKDSVRNGAFVALRDRTGKIVARGLMNRRSQIGFRVLGGPDAPSDLETVLAESLARALRLRTSVLGLPRVTNSFRIVNSEGDGLSGLIIDKLGRTAVVQVGSLGYVPVAETLERHLLAIEGITRVIFLGDEDVQKMEGFHLPEAPAARDSVKEHGLTFSVIPGGRHKTGYFLDQRDNRQLVGRLAAGRNVLDLCTNTGGFALSAARGGAREVTAVDLDEEVLVLAKENARVNKTEIRFTHADIFPWLRERSAAGAPYDLVVLDPARQAKGRDGFDRAVAAYRDMNRLAMSVVAPSGLLLTCSCTSVIAEPLFLSLIQQAAHDAGRNARVVSLSGAAGDHPFAIDFPEGRYLKVVLLQVS